MSGRISLLVDSPLRDLLIVVKNVPKEAGKTSMTYARRAAQPVFKEELSGRASTRTQRRVLGDSGRVGFTGRNVSLRSGAVGRLSSGTPVSDIAVATEFGMRGNAQFGPRTAGNRGKVFYPAASDSAARIISVLIQSYSRSLYDALEGKN